MLTTALASTKPSFGLVVGPSDIVRAVKSISQDPAEAIGETKNLFVLAEKYGLPILDLEQNVLWEPNK